MIKSRKIILVFGVPGVGKSTLINSFIKSERKAVRLSGGSLIAKEISEADRDKLRQLGTNEIILNQEILIQNFQHALTKLSTEHILFDGHCVLKSDDKIVEVPLSVIERLTPTGIVFIQRDAPIILAQRDHDINRPERDRETIDEIINLQNNEISICNKYAIALNIPIKVLENPSLEVFSKAIVRLLTT